MRLSATGNWNDHVTLKTCSLQNMLAIQNTNQVKTWITVAAFLCLDPSFSHR